MVVRKYLQGMAKTKTLVIVESPTKAKTIKKFLDSSYIVESSFGHVRDLPKSSLGVDVEHNFKPKYVVPAKARKQVTELKKRAKLAGHILFATDEDREGEAISWHLAEVLGIQPEKAERIVFHEVTKRAILSALEHPRPLSMPLVDAQQARRVLDRLVGYELSPFLWKKIARGLSAGRVQSVAVRLIVERERERQAFRPEDFWTVQGMFTPLSGGDAFPATLHTVDGKKLEKLSINTQELASRYVSDTKNAEFTVASVKKRDVTRRPSAPYTTSTLQQDANNKLGFSAKQTMMLAQQLYEGVDLGAEGAHGLITYMRTDSVNLSADFTTEAASQIAQNFGKDYASPQPRVYTAKSKLAQEAHEAIRPTLASRTPDAVKPYLDDRQWKLYRLIWNRGVASQMTDAKLAQVTIDLGTSDNNYIFRATGSTIQFPGFLALYSGSVKETLLPKLSEGDAVKASDIGAEQHTTEPPARYTEAALVKELEERGIGRPSTYAPTMSTIQARGYVEKEEKKFKPTEMGMLVNDVLVEHFPNIVDYDFTAKMEDELDEIANNNKPWEPIIATFYQPFKQTLMIKEDEVSKKELTEEATNEVCDKCGKPMVIKLGRFGKFLACSGFPDCKNTKHLDSHGKIEQEETTDEKCDKCGKPMQVKHGRFGKFLGCTGYPECKGIKRIEVTTGVTCPTCEKGEMVQRRSKRGKVFYGCNQYPNCKTAVWSKPTGERCPSCGSLLVFDKDDSHVCSNSDCSFKPTT